LVGIIPVEHAEAAGSYFPYDGVIRSVPGVYVAKEAGATLRALADTGGAVRVTLAAAVEAIKTRNLVGLIPGRSDELIVLHSHTDGTNGVEDNGPDAIVAMAQYLARIPRHEAARTIMVLLTSGHFAGGVGAKAFVHRHRADTLPKIAAAITLEHLGANRWTLHADGTTTPSSAAEPGAFFQPGSAALAAAAYAGLVAGGAAPGFVGQPADDQTDGPRPGSVAGRGPVPVEQRRHRHGQLHHRPDLPAQRGRGHAAPGRHRRVRRAAIGFTDMALALTRVSRRSSPCRRPATDSQESPGATSSGWIRRRPMPAARWRSGGAPQPRADARSARWSMPKRSASQSQRYSIPIVGLSCWQCSAPVSSSPMSLSVTSTPRSRASSCTRWACATPRTSCPPWDDEIGAAHTAEECRRA